MFIDPAFISGPVMQLSLSLKFSFLFSSSMAVVGIGRCL
jgi:hypothetical protein